MIRPLRAPVIALMESHTTVADNPLAPYFCPDPNITQKSEQSQRVISSAEHAPVLHSSILAGYIVYQPAP